jgi:hypothetical protein
VPPSQIFNPSIPIRIGAEMLKWIALGSSIPAAAHLCNVSESRWHRWLSIAKEQPDSEIGTLVESINKAVIEAEARYPSGNGPHSPTSSNGQLPATDCRSSGAPLTRFTQRGLGT